MKLFVRVVILNENTVTSVRCDVEQQFDWNTLTNSMTQDDDCTYETYKTQSSAIFAIKVSFTTISNHITQTFLQIKRLLTTTTNIFRKASQFFLFSCYFVVISLMIRSWLCMCVCVCSIWALVISDFSNVKFSFCLFVCVRCESV